MWKQIRLLTQLEIRNTLGFNEAKYSKDKKAKRRLNGMCFAFGLIGFMMITYIIALCYGLSEIGMVSVIPSYLCAVVSLVVMFFTLFRAGSVIFNMKTYDRLIVLPVQPSVIVISRFLNMYLFDMVLSMVIMIPAMFYCGLYFHLPVYYWVYMFLGSLISPLLPMTIATILSVFVLAISSRLKHRNIVTIILSVVMMLGAMGFSFWFTSAGESMTSVQFTNLSQTIFDMIGKIYPPAILFSYSATIGNAVPFLLFTAISLSAFGLFAIIVGWKFQPICTALASTVSSRNYKMTSLAGSSPLYALFKKELKRYLSCGMYVLNTGIGYIIILLYGGVIAFLGADTVNGYMSIPDFVQNYSAYLIAFMAIVSPSTTSAISLEGKQWWIIKTLPLKAKTVFDSKILVNIACATPFYAVCAVLIAVSVPMSAGQLLRLFLLPAAYIVFGAVMGLFVNLRFPVFNWESETTVVKQSTSVLVAMIFSFVSLAIPVVMSILKPAYADIICVGFSVILFAAAYVMYSLNNRKGLQSIGE